MTTKRNLRLPADLHAHIQKVAAEQGVSMNTLMVALIAGAVGFTLDPAKKADPKDAAS